MPSKNPSTSKKDPVQPPLPPGSPPSPTISDENIPVDVEGAEVTIDDGRDEHNEHDEEEEEEGEQGDEDDVTTVEEEATGTDQPPLPDEPVPSATGVHKGKDPDWTAVWDPTSQAYYFHNTVTGVTQWTNPFENPAVAQAPSDQHSASTQPLPSPSTTTSQIDDEPTSTINYRGIDPDLAFLDPNLARQQTRGGAAPTFQARFNSKTGRFQGDPSMTPDRISDYSRSSRQQQAFYDTTAWTESLQGRGLYQGQQEEEDRAQAGRKRKPSSKEVQAFKHKKEQKKRAKLMTFLKS
ncbi:BQ2448_6339 [Microbotryum intermedium]|uniref:BQ2448_6339 protein n=1 Tax=Microbotryum intermedium TaxID=269621 RepID=A0A238FM96_9BASI|nr:BQ2448_6339 [Microbotryum intermedium]